MLFSIRTYVIAGLWALSSAAIAADFTLSSTDISEGQSLNKAQVFKGFGCEGGNRSPQLSWKNAPVGTEAFAIFAYDPDAPTGSGWWHWQVINIPNSVHSLPSDAGNVDKNQLPKGSQHARNDYGQYGFGGACPPPAHGNHRYQFTVFALAKKLELPKNASSALVGYMVKANSLGSSTIEALYKRDE